MVEPGTPVAEVAAALAEAGGGNLSREDALRTVFVDAASARRLESVPGVSYVEPLTARRRLAFVPNDPLVGRQWYLSQIRAFDAWPQLPLLPGVRVAVLDSGIDARHPEFARKIAVARSFIGGSPFRDLRGHGTFVAGEIAAATGNGKGIAGVAFPAQLVIAKIARTDGTIPLEAEVRAIRWAVDQGARVINLSLAGVRDPGRRVRDTYSRLEASALAYAHRRGALVVAAVGNSDQAPAVPWNYAGYPAALPHVLGVSALTRHGAVPAFSNRDTTFNDLAAPGDDIFSTVPRGLTGPRGTCPLPGYSECGPPDLRHAEGTSFAAPLVSAAAALLFAVRPGLAPDQVATILERSAADVSAGSGCRFCPPGRDRFTGWGRLDVAAAVAAALRPPLPPADRFEPNDGPGARAFRLFGRRGRRINPTIDYWDDPIDVYRVRLVRGQRLTVQLRGPAGSELDLALWRPGTKQLEGRAVAGFRVARSASPGASERISRYRARERGWHYLDVRITKPGSAGYSLTYSKR